jgi:hypothetical protein
MVILYFVGVFVIGAILGGLLATMILGLAESPPQPVIVLILGFICGTIALIFQRFMIITATAFGGAWYVVFGVTWFTAGRLAPIHVGRFFSIEGLSLLFVLFWLALGVAGVIVQYKSTAKGQLEPASSVRDNLPPHRND